MADPKDIGKAFKEKLKGFDQSPSNLSWEDIEPKLPKKEDDTLFYWTKVVGVVIFLLLLIFFAADTYNGNIITENPTNITIKTPVTLEKCDEIDSKNSKLQLPGNEIITTVPVSSKSKSDIDDIYKSTTENNWSILENKTNNGIGLSSNKNVSNSSFRITSKIPLSTHKTGKQAPKIKNGTNKDDEEIKNIRNSANSNTKTNLTNKRTSISSTSITNQIKNKSDKILNNSHNRASKNENLKENKDDSLKTLIASKKNTSINNRKNKDTLVYMTPIKKKPFQKFSIGVHVTPTYTIAPNGSLISDHLSRNTNRGRISLSYGVLFKTYYTEKIALRVGLNRLKLSNRIKNVPTNQLPIILNDLGIILPTNTSIENSEKIDLIQKTIYNEVLFGLQYQILENQISTALIGELGFLFLDENNIKIHTISDNFKLGSNTNILKTNFSINIGANLRYKLSKKIFFNVEPLLKYQLKNASENSESYRPLYFTIQTGVSYEF
ncbi:hypothetical protein ATO12_12840 [Aquimarina atlantica]|uniref:Outer membrane protein beta-barrel domain-containing protein n=1 Tax=Aquimarina atlantica TaxID=1317122 RepID=A0A023BX40_9FLAO|nr:hypothetical protein [Aquimarina atlantica]EZH74647.1 hypothetical protein ATO12_12840 [Aquimarina atlantica]